MKADSVVPGTFKVFADAQHAVVLSARKETGEESIIVTILTRDTEHWVIQTGGFHNHWLLALQGLLNEALAWLVSNADPVPDDGIALAGWKVRKVVATELEWLKWFAQNADFGPADGAVRAEMREEFRCITGKELPKGWRGED